MQQKHYTTISFSLLKEIFNTVGEKVSTLVSENLEAGIYEYEWNASEQASGIYFYRLRAENFIQTEKMILLR